MLAMMIMMMLMTLIIIVNDDRQSKLCSKREPLRNWHSKQSELDKKDKRLGLTDGYRHRRSVERPFGLSQVQVW